MTATIAIIQARMSSERFPGKVIEDLGGMPMIAFMVRRVRRAVSLTRVVVATSSDPSDDALAQLLAALRVDCFRGDLHDVLARFAGAAERFGAGEIVRLTADCPLADPAIVDGVVGVRREAGVDYSSNIEPRTFADGFDVECFTRGALDRAAGEAREPAEREHVTPWMRSAAAGLRRANFGALADSSRLRLTVDYPADLAAIRLLVGHIGRPPEDFDQFDVLRCLAAHPEIGRINASAGRLR